MVEALLVLALIGWGITYLNMRLKIKGLTALVEFQSVLLDLNQSLWDIVLGKKTYTDNVVPFRRKD